MGQREGQIQLRPAGVFQLGGFGALQPHQCRQVRAQIDLELQVGLAHDPVAGLTAGMACGADSLSQPHHQVLRFRPRGMLQRQRLHDQAVGRQAELRFQRPLQILERLRQRAGRVGGRVDSLGIGKGHADLDTGRLGHDELGVGRGTDPHRGRELATVARAGILAAGHGPLDARDRHVCRGLGLAVGPVVQIDGIQDQT